MGGGSIFMFGPPQYSHVGSLMSKLRRLPKMKIHASPTRKKLKGKGVSIVLMSKDNKIKLINNYTSVSQYFCHICIPVWGLIDVQCTLDIQLVWLWNYNIVRVFVCVHVHTYMYMRVSNVSRTSVKVGLCTCNCIYFIVLFNGLPLRFVIERLSVLMVPFHYYKTQHVMLVPFHYYKTKQDGSCHVQFLCAYTSHC